MSPWPPFQDVCTEAYGKHQQQQYTNSLFLADVDGDGVKEILLGGIARFILLDKPSYPLEVRGRLAYGAELLLIRFAKQKLELIKQEQWCDDDIAEINSVFAADVDGDGKMEIIVAGSSTTITAKSEKLAHYRTWAHLKVFNWDGKNLILRASRSWAPRPFPNACLNSVWAGDIDGDGKLEILVAGSAWNADTEVAWFEVFNGGPQPLLVKKGRKIWKIEMGVTSRIKAIAAKELDADGKVEIVTASSLTWRNNRITLGKAQLIAWNAQPGTDDSAFDFVEKAQVEWRDNDFTEIRSLWLGDVDNEQGMEVVTGGITLQGPKDDPDFTGADIRIWRLSGSSFKEINKLNLILTTPSDHYWLTSCNSIFAADIDNDGLKELLIAGELAVRGQIIVCYLGALDPKNNWMSAGSAGKIVSKKDLFKKFSTFGFVHYLVGRMHGCSKGVMATDFEGDGRMETVLAGYYHKSSSGNFVWVLQ